VMVEKEGTAVGRHFAQDGASSFVLDYPLGKRGIMSTSKRVAGIVVAAKEALEHVRSLCSEPGVVGPVDVRLGRLDAAR